MTWSSDNYPTDFEAFPPNVRNKMIDIANRLIAEEGEEEVAAVDAAITLGKQWAAEQGIDIEDVDNT